MEIRLLKYFLSVTEELHFTRAAENLGISQPTLSQQIKLLEERLDTKLFHRNGATIELTESGKVLLKHVNRIFFEIDQVKTEISKLEGKDFGELRIGSSGNHLLYSSLIPFYKEYPNIKVSVYDSQTIKTIENLLSSNYDIGVVLLPVHHPQIEVIPLYSSDLCAVISESHPFAENETIELKNLKRFPLFLYPEKYHIRKTISEYCETIGITLDPVFELSDTYSLIKVATFANGITILPRSYVEHEKNLPFKIIEIDDPMPKIEVGAIYRKGMKLSAAIQAFIFHLKEYN